MYRGGLEKPRLERLIPALGGARVQKLEKDILATPLVEASSSDIRGRIIAGQPVDALLPVGVLRYIEQKGIYAQPPSKNSCQVSSTDQ
jgi:nicotinic acid mononucleotide adenylyltransferase